ncbi:MAG: carboxypeptidase regulatory-like domain-containing protein [Planctomycetes bacterium]|nr:carboxypeptidase regulatory-like domain-containing protein [Planctomycetota bacterium]
MPRPLFCWLLLVCAASAGGCGTEPPAVADPPAPPAPAPGAFDPTACGTITGLVTWTGPEPTVPPVQAFTPRPDGPGLASRTVPLANAPRIDHFTRAVAGAVVYLREVDVARARPWDLPNVEVEFRDSQIVVKQGDRTGRTGFVKRGDAITARSAEPTFHVLRARGAAFFALPFPDPDRPLTRTLDKCGRVELTSAAGCYWQAADLFACDHPYYAVSDAEGRFHFASVPEGRYDLVAWHPNWVVTRTERNPETGQPSRLIYAPPLETSRPASVSRGGKTLANLTLPK